MIASTSVFLFVSLALAVAAAVRHSAARSRARTARLAGSGLASADDEPIELQPDARIYFLDVYRAARASMLDESDPRHRHSAPALRSVSLGVSVGGSSVGGSASLGSVRSERPRPA